MKWGTLYGPEYVNRLFAGVQRQLKQKHRFVCFTEDARGLDPRIEVLPLLQTGAPEVEGDTRWRKVAVFAEKLVDLAGPTLFLDLDLVVVGSLDAFFEHPGEVCIIRDAELFPDRWLRRLRPARRAFYQKVGNSSVFRFHIGRHTDVLRRYVDDHARVVAEYRNEQEFISDHFHAQNKLTFWPREWYASFKHDCVPKGLRSYLQDPQLPPAARVVLFAGRPKMADVVAGRGGRWYRRIGPAPWLIEHWTGGAGGS